MISFLSSTSLCDTWILNVEDLRRATFSFVSVRLSAWDNSSSTGGIFVKFDIWRFFSENLSGKFNFYQNLTRITGTLLEGVRTFLIISRSILLSMRNVSDKSCRENQNTHFVFNNLFFAENRFRLLDSVENYGTATQATDDNTAHAHCLLHT